jgi:hypothetical protein
VKRQAIKVEVRYQKRERLEFGTKLGINSPFWEGRKKKEKKNSAWATYIPNVCLFTYPSIIFCDFWSIVCYWMSQKYPDVSRRVD